MKTKKKYLSNRIKEEISAYLFVLPQLIGCMVFIFAPMVIMMVLSLFQWDYIGEMKWVGLQNFKIVLTDPETWEVALHTTKFVFIYFPLAACLSLVAAVILNKDFFAKGFYRTALFLPSIIPQAVVAIVWLYFLAPGIGVIDMFLNMLGLEGQQWLYISSTVIPVIALICIWQNFGWLMIIFIAGLKTIPFELYEAATIDGANTVIKFFKITLPLISPTLFFILTTGAIGGYLQFTETYLLTMGGPDGASYFFFQYIYDLGLRYYKVGDSSAVSVFLFVIISLITFIQFKLSDRWVVYNED